MDTPQWDKADPPRGVCEIDPAQRLGGTYWIPVSALRPLSGSVLSPVGLLSRTWAVDALEPSTEQFVEGITNLIGIELNRLYGQGEWLHHPQLEAAKELVRRRPAASKVLKNTLRES